MILQQPLLHAWKKQFHTVLGLQGVCPCKLSEFFKKSGQVLIRLLAVHAPKPDVILGAVHGEVPRAVDGDGQDARWFVRVRQIDREAVDFFPDTAVCLIRAFKQDIAVQNLQKSFLFFCIRVGKRELPLLLGRQMRRCYGIVMYNMDLFCRAEVPHNIPQRGWMKEQGETEENCQENANPDQRPGNGLSETLRGEADFF